MSSVRRTDVCVSLRRNTVLESIYAFFSEQRRSVFRVISNSYGTIKLGINEVFTIRSGNSTDESLR